MNIGNKLLLNIMAFSGLSLVDVGNAIGQELQTQKRSQANFFEKLPLDVIREIITVVSKTGTLQESAHNIQNLVFVSKKLEQFINSEVGIQIILGGLLENKNVQSFFDQLYHLIEIQENEYKKKGWSGTSLDMSRIKDVNTQKRILLAALPIKQAKNILLQQSSPKDWADMEYYLLHLLFVTLNYISNSKIKDEYFSFIPTLIYVALRVAKVLTNLDKLSDSRIPQYFKAEIEKNYPEYKGMLEKYGELFQGPLKNYPEYKSMLEKIWEIFSRPFVRMIS